jgi:hypothetical protein
MWKQQFTRRSNYAQVPALARQFAFHFIAIKLSAFDIESLTRLPWVVARQYAEEAMRWAVRSKTEAEKHAFMELARTWTQAALQSKGAVVVTDDSVPAPHPVRPRLS